MKLQFKKYQVKFQKIKNLKIYYKHIFFNKYKNKNKNQIRLIQIKIKFKNKPQLKYNKILTIQKYNSKIILKWQIKNITNNLNYITSHFLNYKIKFKLSSQN